VKIDVSPEFQRASDEPQGEEFLSLRNAIVAALKEARPLLEKRLMFPLQQLGTYDHLTNRLSKTRSLNNFNGIWDALYDWADRSRVWINTF
jgi:hypothetical protein